MNGRRLKRFCAHSPVIRRSISTRWTRRKRRSLPAGTWCKPDIAIFNKITLSLARGRCYNTIGDRVYPWGETVSTEGNRTAIQRSVRHRPCRQERKQNRQQGGFIMDKQIRRIGVLTSGGDAPGMNALIRSVVRSASGKRYFRSRHSPRLQRSYQRRHHRDGCPQCRRHYPQGRHHAVHRTLQGDADRGRSAESG